MGKKRGISRARFNTKRKALRQSQKTSKLLDNLSETPSHQEPQLNSTPKVKSCVLKGAARNRSLLSKDLCTPTRKVDVRKEVGMSSSSSSELVPCGLDFSDVISSLTRSKIALSEVFFVCRKPDDGTLQMIGCDNCNE